MEISERVKMNLKLKKNFNIYYRRDHLKLFILNELPRFMGVL